MRPAYLLTLLACAGLMMLSAPRASADNLIVNGSFGTGDLTGWSYNGGGLDIVAASGFDNYNAEDLDGCSTVQGSSTPYGCFVALGDFSTSTLSQSFADTVNGGYFFSFYFASDGTKPSSFQAEWDSTSLLDLSDPPSTGGAYNFYSYAVTGSGSDTISFNSMDQGGYLALDNVSVSAQEPLQPTPEPATLALLAAGLLGLSPGVRRRLLPGR